MNGKEQDHDKREDFLSHIDRKFAGEKVDMRLSLRKESRDKLKSAARRRRLRPAQLVEAMLDYFLFD